MARSQKPFVVEVKRGRRGAFSAPPATAPKPPEAALKAAEASFAPQEPPRPKRRILDAIEPEPALVTAPEEEPAVVDPLKRRRGRPPKVAGALPSPKKQRPAVNLREEAPIIAVARREAGVERIAQAAPSQDSRVAPSREPRIAPSHETKKITPRPQSLNHGLGDRRITSSLANHAPATHSAGNHIAVNLVVATHSSASHSNASHSNASLGHLTHGHLTHGDRAEAATNLPRGERWKRRLPKVLW